MITLSINGKDHTVDVPTDMPILWALRDVVGLTGTKFGCGMALCGACTVHVDGQPIRSCVTPVAAAVGKKITTIEAIGGTPTGKKVQQAWLDLEVVQCGYCQSGQIMSASALIAKNAHPSDADIDAAMRSEEHTSELQSPCNLVCRLLLEKKKKKQKETLREKLM